MVLRLFLALISGLWASAVHAQAAAPARLCDGVFATVTLTSDYRYEGLSSSNRRPTWQGLAHCYRSDGAYAGVLVTGIDYLDTPRTRAEIDLYAGRRFRRGRWELNLELLYSAFRPPRTSGSGYDLIEPEIELARTAGRATWTTKVGLAWNATTRRTWHFSQGLGYRLTPWLTANSRLGAVLSERGMDRRYGEIGLTASWRRLSLEARYVVTDRSRGQCYGLNWCEDGATAAVTYRLLP
jgi:uncharacterized protein (TIGR02001 family)